MGVLIASRVPCQRLARSSATDLPHQLLGCHDEVCLAAQDHRLAARRGTKRAAVAVGHTILLIVYRLLSEGDVYRDLGERYFDERDRRAVERRLVSRLEGLGYKVALEPAA